jgi:hypothetical protein
MVSGTVTVAKSTNIRVKGDLHRKLSIISSVTGEDIGAIASEILADPVEERYRKALAALRKEEDEVNRAEKGKKKDHH